MDQPDGEAAAPPQEAAPGSVEAIASPGLYRALLDHMTEGVSLSDETGTIVYTNPAEDALFGYAPGELVGQDVSVQNAYPEAENRRRVDEVIAHLKAHGRWEGEWHNRRKNGEAFVTASRITAVDIAGKPHWLCVQRDVTESRRAEAAQIEAEARLRAVFDQAAAGLARVDLQGRFIAANDNYCTLVGRSRDELMGLRMQDITHPDDLPANAQLFHGVVAGGPPFDIVKRYVRPDGSEVWVRNSVSAVRGEDGTIRSILAVCVDVTDRIDAEARLRESEERYRTLFEAIDAGFCVIEMIFDGERIADGRFVEVNPAFERQTGLKGAVGRTIRDLIPTPQARWFEYYEKVVRTGKAARFESGSETLDGWYDVHAMRVGPPEARRVALLFNDISERRRSEISLRELNATLEKRIGEALAERKVLADVVEGADAFVQVVGLDWRWLAINRAASDAFERMFGTRPKAGDDILAYLGATSELRETHASRWARAFRGETFVELTDFDVPDLGRRCYEMKFSPLRDADGAVVGAHLFTYDVTRRIREERRLEEAEAARREADALYRTYFENTPEALFVVGVAPDGRFLVEQSNPAHEAGVGLRLEDIRGKRVDEVLPPAAGARVIETYRQVVETGSILQYREIFDLTGEPQHWDTSLMPMRGPDGQIVRLIGSSRNVTRQVMAEEALRQAQKMESIGQLTGGVAHDFNNLLTPIVGVLDILQRRQIGGEREQRLIAGAAQSAERAKTLVQRLLAFARRQPLQPTAVDVARLVNGMAELVASTTGPQIKITVEAPDDLPPAQADANQLEMALLNLAVNARDAMPDGGALRISASADAVAADNGLQLRPGRYLCLSVADTGFGMSDATLARAIEPFFSTKGVGKGTGLGLSMVHGLASQLGGALRIRSKPGLGTNVELWLPESTDPAAETAPRPAPPPVRSRGRALLVDDEALVRLSTADMLAELGYEVVEADCGESALETVRNGAAIDLVVTDHLMPGMTGSQLALEARALRPGIPILVISGYAESHGVDPSLPRLTKPFRRDELAASLAELT